MYTYNAWDTMSRTIYDVYRDNVKIGWFFDENDAKEYCQIMNEFAKDTRKWGGTVHSQDSRTSH